MLPGPPLPLPSNFPLSRLFDVLPAAGETGAWVRTARRNLKAVFWAGRQSRRVVLGPDLGSLLRRCSLLVVNVNQHPHLLRAEELIRCRALRIVIGTPYLPRPDQLKGLFPDVELEPTGFSVPLTDRPPEEVLGLCLSHDIPVMESRISYRA